MGLALHCLWRSKKREGGSTTKGGGKEGTPLKTKKCQGKEETATCRFETKSQENNLVILA